MNYGQIKREALKLIFSDTSAGSPIPDSYNNQADYVKAIPGLVDDAQTFLASVKRIPAAIPLRELKSTRLGGCRVYTMPSDFQQMMAGGLLVPTDGLPTRSHEFRLCGGNRLFVPVHGEDWMLEYWRLPVKVGDDPEDSTPIDNTPEVQSCIPLYVAAHLVLYDDPYRYAALYGEFESRVAALRESVFIETDTVTDVYGGFGGMVD